MISNRPLRLTDNGQDVHSKVKVFKWTGLFIGPVTSLILAAPRDVSD